MTLVHYQRNKEKIVKIKEEFQHTQEYCNKKFQNKIYKINIILKKYKKM